MNHHLYHFVYSNVTGYTQIHTCTNIHTCAFIHPLDAFSFLCCVVWHAHHSLLIKKLCNFSFLSYYVVVLLFESVSILLPTLFLTTLFGCYLFLQKLNVHFNTKVPMHSKTATVDAMKCITISIIIE